ncbi:tyrosine-type recombinase/integrase [Segeticoccus rhizosphaerae]|uniref:tyrosine-type recombinase/integrase n=1 Tax=Segeticoccus rhizosphaerae TaxID=1104777 RepID=UPI00192E3847|nr:site-specific integrase [Ornithinicoccus soli]
MPTPVIARPTVWTASQQSVEEVLVGIEALERGASDKEMRRRLRDASVLLHWLQRFAGESWQQRWLASGADTAARAWPDLLTDGAPDGLPAAGLPDKPQAARTAATGTAGRLILLDVIRPGYDWLYSNPSKALFPRFEQLRDPAGFAAVGARCDADRRMTSTDRRAAFVQLCRVLMHNGGLLADITLADCVEAYRAQTGYSTRVHSRWYGLLRDLNILGQAAPPTIHAANRRGQLTIEEIVDSYQIACRPIRDLFVDYLSERAPGLDYSTIRQLASKLILLFWRDLELHEPGIDSLHLSDATARAWKQRLGEVRYGNHYVGEKRRDPYIILMAVRAFYADLSHWALEDPARWAKWAAPSPVDSRDLAGLTKANKHRQARMHQRIRELAPLLPRLVDTAHARRVTAEDLLAAATQAAPGQLFSAAGQTLRRALLVSDPALGGNSRPGVIYAVEPEAGETPTPDAKRRRRNLTVEADRAFWAWACVEVFRHTGVRIEEMLEITHRSFVSYTLPATGEVIPMLQITPSKTDKERLLVISPELAAVFATIIHHVRDGNEHLPLVTRYDSPERIHTAPLPFLFQRRWGMRDQSFTHGYVKKLLDELVKAAGVANPDGSPARFSPHDFRRIFATEAVAAGLPVHITAKILGHESLTTTQTYLAVYDQDVIDHHRAFLARRRATRPSQEYREPTDSEWDEFLGHFAKRKLALGTCGRAYGTGCQHEHACIRCPMLRPDPTQQPRLEEIITNLTERITEATERGWLGDVDGLRASLDAAQHKLTQMRRTATNLGMPSTRTPQQRRPRRAAAPHTKD